MAGNQFIEDAQRLTWTKEDEKSKKDNGKCSKKEEETKEKKQKEGSDFLITLKPMQIRTWIVEILT